MKNTVVIMAGGKGERFWPKSRKNCPKQFLSLTNDGKTMLRLTVERLLPLVDIEDIFVVTNADYVGLVKEQIPEMPIENILAEPFAKNTAPCIGLATAHIAKKYGQAVMLILASDHLIKNKELYLSTVREGLSIAQEEGNIVTIGITPTYPETGYGYINFETTDERYNVYKVKKFVEKPNLERARDYLDDGTYLWNSGMFVFSTDTILHNFKTFMPALYEGVMKIKDSLETGADTTVLLDEYSKFQSESIDTGIMEKAEHIYVLPGSFGWDDVGSWNALERINRLNDNGNVCKGNTITIDVKDSIVYGNDKLLALVGVEDLVVVDTGDATLICAKDRTQDIKKVLENLRICNREEYL